MHMIVSAQHVRLSIYASIRRLYTRTHVPTKSELYREGLGLVYNLKWSLLMNPVTELLIQIVSPLNVLHARALTSSVDVEGSNGHLLIVG